MDDWKHGGFGVYVHWPFCQSKCPYCDFNSHVRQAVDQAHWRKALVQELRTNAELTGPRTVNTVFFGGGTPSLMEPETVRTVIEAIDDLWGLAPDAEITLEANPTSVESNRFAGYVSAGVNRISIGIQALNDADLKALGRLHSTAEARQAYEVARKLFDRVSFDLIYARQHQSLSEWRKELTEACNMAVDHLSLYQLTVEHDTRFGELHAKGRLRGLPNDDLAADMYELTQEICNSFGMPGYEVSNHAPPGMECQHNLVYWRYGDYVGVGPGAHGRVTTDGKRLATVTERMPEGWLNSVDTQGHALVSSTAVDLADQADECLMMSLRLSEGVDLSRISALSGRSISQGVLDELISKNLLVQNNDIIKATDSGKIILNWVLKELLV